MNKWIGGSILGIIGVLIALFAVTPKVLEDNIYEWFQIEVIRLTSSFLLGCLITNLILNVIRYAKNKSNLSKDALFFSSDKFDAKVNELLETNKFNEFLVFGYTGETVSDYFKYSTRYNKTITIRVLNRDWKIEEGDQIKHNKNISALNIRRWDKAKSIEHNSTIPWLFDVKRIVKYYKEHPSIKAIMLVGPSETACFLTFYHWIKIPENGGSPFKGRSLSMIYLNSKMSESANNILIYLKSQFEYCWEKCELNENPVQQEP